METKQQIRARHISIRNAMDEAEVLRFSSGISQNLKKFFYNVKNLEKYGVYGYYPCQKEAALFKLYAWLLNEKIPLAFPRVSGEVMDFYRVSSMEDFVEGAFHIMEPKQSCEKACFLQAFCCVPGSVFDYAGNRLGYGKGYYDRYFSEHSSLYRIGIAYENQLENSLHTEKHDIKMQSIVTEKKMYLIGMKEGIWN